jgi:hypothetical protein
MRLVFSALICLTVFSFASGPAFAVSDSMVAEFERADWDARILTDQGIARFRTDPQFQELLSMVNNPGIDWGIRIKGIKLMGAMGTDRAATHLVDMMNDPFFNHECPSIKSYVAAALGNYRGDSSVVTALINGTKDRELLVREASVRSLGMIGDRRAVPAVIEALKDESDAVRLRAISALGRIGDPQAVPYLRGIADGPGDRVIKEQAAGALQEISGAGR